MSGLLQRLAGQALGAQASGAPRIRPAASVHAQVPVSPLREVEEARQTPTLVHQTPQLPAQDSRPASPAQQLPPQASSKTIQSVGGDRQFAPQPNFPRPAATRVAPPRELSEPSNEYTSHDFVGKAPPRLLEEVQLMSAPPAITPVTPVPLPVAVTPRDSRAEPTEVHVHIGRIEVIAAPEPVSPKKNRATTARNTLPLADYLARGRRS